MVRAWFVFLLAPNLGSLAGSLLGSSVGISDRTVLADSTSADDILRAVGLVTGGLVAGFFLLRERSRTDFLVDVPPEQAAGGYWFPGRWLGGLSMIASPLLLLAGELLRIRFYFYYPQQLAAFASRPGLVLASYSLYTLGLVLLLPAFLALAHFIG